jgi:dynein heavy chain
VLASQKFIRRVLGEEFMAAVTDQIIEVWEESAPCKPILFLLAPGSDPTNTIDELARKKRIPTQKVSMGEEQEIIAKKNIDDGMRDGFWVILNNCHLSLEFMAEIEDILNPKDKVIHEQFRVWITCEPHNEFPLGLLQMAIKVTTEAPKGIAAGMARTFNTLITQDFLEKVEPYEKWRGVVFALCFMHSIVYERRKFGPLGFCIGYEFNSADLEASLIFIENHMANAFNHNLLISWRAIRYMVCDVQYGGRITDDLDREMFWTYGELWLTERVFNEKDFSFNTLSEFPYIIPDFPEIPKYQEYINTFPEKDSPVIFGMNVSADLTFRLAESQAMINTLIDTMPKEAGGGSGRTKEDEVRDKLETDLIRQLPDNFIEQDYKEKLSAMGIPRGLSPDKNVPLNIFLRQEIEQFQCVLDIVRKTMSDMVDAIAGSIIMTADLVDSIDKIFDFRVPAKWQFQAGAEISWLTPSLAGWIKGLIDRHFQLNTWLTKGSRPISFWLTGFYNPQGFLTAALQEVTRQHSEQKWSLDSVEPKTDVLKEIIGGEDGRIEKSFSVPSEGVCIHGLYIEGAAWSRNERRLEDQVSKDPF